jgi:transcriptional regulator of acetoin/glycerol metabolism
VLPLSGQVEAMVVRDVTRLTLADQHRLVRWMDERGAGTQVISTAPAAVTPLVHAGAFLETLYYRLNVLYVELHA